MSSFWQNLHSTFYLVLFAGYLLARKLYTFLQIRILWPLFKISQAPPDRSVRLYSIIWRHKRDLEEVSGINDFILTHHAFAPLAILDSPYWALYALDHESVYFVQLPEKMPEYNVKKHPFIYISCYKEAFCVAEISRADFLELGIRLAGKRKLHRPTVLATNTARSGSTLFATMLQHDGVSVVYGEPYPLIQLSIGLGEGYWTEQDVEELIGPVINYLRKDVPEDQLCILKTTSGEARLIPYTRQLHLKHIFIFRNNGLASVERMALRDPSLPLLIQLYRLSPTVSNWLGWLAAYEGKWTRALKPRNVKEWAALCYISPYTDYLKWRDDFGIPIIWYHDLIENTETTLLRVFREFGIPHSCLTAALNCKNRDSQAGSHLNQGAMSAIIASTNTIAVKDRLRYFARQMNIPPEILLPEESE